MTNERKLLKNIKKKHAKLERKLYEYKIALQEVNWANQDYILFVGKKELEKPDDLRVWKEAFNETN